MPPCYFAWHTRLYIDIVGRLQESNRDWALDNLSAFSAKDRNAFRPYCTAETVRQRADFGVKLTDRKEFALFAASGYRRGQAARARSKEIMP